MIDRFERRFDRSDRRHGGSGRARDHDKLDAEQAGGLDLGISGRTTAVLGNDRVDAIFPHELYLAFEREGTAVEYVFDVSQSERRIDGIDATHEVEMLRRDLRVMGTLSACRQKDAPKGRAKRGDGSGNIRHDMPVIAGFRNPLRADERDGGNAGAFHCRRGIGRNALGERMGGVDQQIVTSRHQEFGKAFRPAEAADADGNGLFGWCLRAAGQRQQDVEIVSAGKLRGKPARLACAAQDQNAGLVHV